MLLKYIVYIQNVNLSDAIFRIIFLVNDFLQMLYCKFM